MKNTVEYQASEISRILDSGIEILPNSPIHNALKKALNMSVVSVSLGFDKGYEKGWTDATSEAIVEINKNYQPNER